MIINKDFIKILSSELQAELKKLLGEGVTLVLADYKPEKPKDDTIPYVHYECRSERFYTLNDSEGKRINQWYQMPLMGCCGVEVYANFKDFIAAPAKRDWYVHKGLALLQNKIAIDIAKTGGYTRLLATEDDKMVYSIQVFKLNGWTELGEPFVNKRTKNTIRMFIYTL